MAEEVDQALVDLLAQSTSTQPESPPIVQEPTLLPPDLPEPPSPSTVLTQDSPVDELGIKQMLSKFSSSIDVILQNQVADRQQAETTFLLLDSVVRNALANNTRLSSAITEAWVKCLQIKVDINTNATSALDSITKLLAAGKKNDLIVNMNNNQLNADTGGIDLIKLLTDGQSTQGSPANPESDE